MKGRAEVHKQDPGVGSCGVQVLENEVKGHVYGIVYRPVGSVGNLQGVQERVSDGFEMTQHKALKCLHHYRGQGDGSVVIDSLSWYVAHTLSLSLSLSLSLISLSLLSPLSSPPPPLSLSLSLSLSPLTLSPLSLSPPPPLSLSLS